MKFETLCLCLVAFAVHVLAYPQNGHGQDKSSTLGRIVNDVTITDARTGKPWRLSVEREDLEAVILFFNTTECPVTNRYLPKLNKIHEDYREQKVLVVSVNSSAHDSPEEIKNHLKKFDVGFTVLHDRDGELARMLNVTRTAEAFVLDSKRKIRYRGAVDDRFERGITKPKVRRDYLKDALVSVLNGRPIATTLTEVTACPLDLPAPSQAQSPNQKITFAKHVSPILQKRCQVCHHQGGIGPFELATYEDAKSWADSIREVIAQDLMPPWHADAPHGHFSNDRSLTDLEYTTLLNWIDTGMLPGDLNTLPKTPTFPNSWTIGSPDLVLKMEKEIEVPAATPELGVPYKYVWASQPFDKEMWVRKAEVRPGATEVVHHATAYIVPKGVKLDFVNDERPGGALTEFSSPINSLPFLVAFVPGDNSFALDDGLAKRIPKGARILFEMHYTPNGRKQKDRTELGLVFAKAPPKHEVLSSGTLNYWFSIPPGASRHPVVARSEKFKKDSVLLSMNPHMHYRGKSFKYELVQPSGEKQLLLNVPRYSFDWQSTYWLSKPVKVPKGSRIICSATFDNSEENPFNPDASVRVTWGEQSWQEMMLASWEYYENK